MSVTTTDPVAVAVLETIYKNNGPGRLNWDFSVPGQVTDSGETMKSENGRLIELNLSYQALSGILKIHNLETLEKLDIYDRFYVDERNDLAGIDLLGLPALHTLWLGSDKIIDIGPLAGLTQLADLKLSCARLSDLSPLAGLIQLTSLDINGDQLSNPDPLAGLLVELYLSGGQISDLSPKSDLNQLIKYRAAALLRSYPSRFIHGGLGAFIDLNLRGCDNISDLAPLAGLTQLTCLKIGGDRISDLSPLAGLAQLTNLYLHGKIIGEISDMAELKEYLKGPPNTGGYSLE